MTADEIAIRQALKRTLDVWPGRAPNVDVYYDALSDLPPTAVLEGIGALVREWHFSQRPVPGDFRRHAQDCVNSDPQETTEGDDGYLRDSAGRYVVMDEMATREAYRREFNHVPSGWTDEAIADRRARLDEYRRLAQAPRNSRLQAVLAAIKRGSQMP